LNWLRHWTMWIWWISKDLIIWHYSRLKITEK